MKNSSITWPNHVIITWEYCSYEIQVSPFSFLWTVSFPLSALTYSPSVLQWPHFHLTFILSLLWSQDVLCYHRVWLSTLTSVCLLSVLGLSLQDFSCNNIFKSLQRRTQADILRVLYERPGDQNTGDLKKSWLCQKSLWSCSAPLQQSSVCRLCLDPGFRSLFS